LREADLHAHDAPGVTALAAAADGVAKEIRCTHL
jgi:hypothetical protein